MRRQHKESRWRWTRRLLPAALALALLLAVAPAHGGRQPRGVVPDAAAAAAAAVLAGPQQWGDGGSSGEYAFNLAAFADGRRGLVRLYSEIEPRFVEPIAAGRLEQPHVNSCHFLAANGTGWSVRTQLVDVQWKYGDDERIRTVNKVVAYTLDCPDPGPAAVRAAAQLSTGAVLGRHIPLEVMETERKGRLAACSQPLFTRVAGIRDWVDYHARMGVEAFHMHVPVGPHIDALFDPSEREQRIAATTRLNERSPESVGAERFQRFSHPKVTWQEYHGAPTANYYSETPLFNACVYRYRYAYDYVMLYDCDEWFMLRRPGNGIRGGGSPRTITGFLDKALPPHVASLQLDSLAFPAQCATSDHGDYVSRFTLRKKAVWENMQKLIVRPLAVACTAIHGVFDITEQFKSAHVDASNQTIAERYLKLPINVAYIKHIRWFGPPNGTAIYCKFGAEAAHWDPEFSLVIQDDSPRRPSKEPPSLASVATS